MKPMVAMAWSSMEVNDRETSPAAAAAEQRMSLARDGHT